MSKLHQLFLNSELSPCSKQIVRECDEGVRKMKQIEELVRLEILMDFGNVKVTFCFLTVFLEQTRLFA